eukprot:g44110.t1
MSELPLFRHSLSLGPCRQWTTNARSCAGPTFTLQPGDPGSTAAATALSITSSPRSGPKATRNLVSEAAAASMKSGVPALGLPQLGVPGSTEAVTLLMPAFPESATRPGHHMTTTPVLDALLLDVQEEDEGKEKKEDKNGEKGKEEACRTGNMAQSNGPFHDNVARPILHNTRK